MSDQSTPPRWGEPSFPPGSGPTGPEAAPPAGERGGRPYASGARRVGAALADAFVPVPALGVIGIGIAVAFSGATSTADPVTGRATVEGVSGLGFAIMGLGVLLVVLVGRWTTVVRQVVHVVDQVPCYLGCLWPLWDPPAADLRRQDHDHRGRAGAPAVTAAPAARGVLPRKNLSGPKSGRLGPPAPRLDRSPGERAAPFGDRLWERATRSAWEGSHS